MVVESYIHEASRLLLRDGFSAEPVMGALETIGRGLGVDRAYIFEDSVDPATGRRLTSQRYEWSAASVTPQIDNPLLQSVPYAEVVSEWEERFAVGLNYEAIVGDLEDGPLRQLLESQQIRSILVCPIFLDGQCWGFVGFDDCQGERHWPREEVRALAALARVLGGSLRHNTMHAGMLEARERLRAILEG